MGSHVAHVQLVSTKGTAGDKLRTRTWIEIQLLGEDDQPIPSAAYALKLPGGKIVEGTLDDKGCARVDNIPPGRCEISFPELDKAAWTPIETKTEPA